jgi:prenyltransferase beta subunit
MDTTSNPTTSELENIRHHRAQAVQFLLGNLMEAKDGSGLLFYSRMKSRVLDTALVLHILQKEGLEPEWQQQLGSYLTDNVFRADRFSSIVARGVLAMSLRGGAMVGIDELMEVLEYAKRRKYALLGMTLVEVGALPMESFHIDPNQLSQEAEHLFSRLYVTAIKVLYEKRRRSGANLKKELAFLAEAQGTNGGWQQQSLITSFALLALGPKHEAFANGLRFLKTLTMDDGGVAFSDNLNLWTTSLAGLALHECAEIDEPVFHRIGSYILSRQHQNGGWSFSEDVTQTDTDTSAHCAQLLVQLDPIRYVDPISRAHEYFLRLQRPDGGYPTYELAGQSEVTITANIAIVQALGIDRFPHLRGPIERALRFMQSRQRPNGTFERSWSLSEIYSIFRVNLALNTCSRLDNMPDIQEVQRKFLEYLLSSQHVDGGWGQTATKPSDALSTSYALLSLVLLRRSTPTECIDKALMYLLSQQDGQTGAFNSVPDVVGPRPIVFNVPLLSTIFPVLALRMLEPP